MNEHFILMHRDVPVMDCVFDDGYLIATGNVYNMDHMPVMHRMNPTGKPSVREFADWWERRAVPKHRFALKDLFDRIPAAYSDIKKLSAVSLGLGLSDTYWIKPEGSCIAWDDVNFFDNDFGHGLSDAMLGYDGKRVLIARHTDDGFDLYTECGMESEIVKDFLLRTDWKRFWNIDL